MPRFHAGSQICVFQPSQCSESVGSFLTPVSATALHLAFSSWSLQLWGSRSACVLRLAFSCPGGSKVLPGHQENIQMEQSMQAGQHRLCCAHIPAGSLDKGPGRGWWAGVSAEKMLPSPAGKPVLLSPCPVVSWNWSLSEGDAEPWGMGTHGCGLPKPPYTQNLLSSVPAEALFMPVA